MRDFFLNSEGLLDMDALSFLEREEIPGILPCTWVRWNERVQLVYFLNEYNPLASKIDKLTLDEVCEIAVDILDTLEKIEISVTLSPENVVWDMDSIYIDSSKDVYLVCLPAVLPVEVLESRIYTKRVYAVLSDMVSSFEGGDLVARQIEDEKNKAFGDWKALKAAITRRNPSEDEYLVLRSVNTAEPLTFKIGHEKFYIGSDPEQCAGCIPGAVSISPSHAMIGWNGISYYVCDCSSREGTYLNDIKLSPQTQVPFGRGSVLRFAECTFSVE